MGGYQWETMDDLTDISGEDDDRDGDDATTSAAVPPAKKLKTEEGGSVLKASATIAEQRHAKELSE